jgi:Protein of unknown function (DUF1566)
MAKESFLHALHRLLVGLIVPFLAASALAAERFSPSGAEVLDTATGLIWQRCALGQSWSGSTCEGTASLLTHAAALQAALQASAGGTPWRLPNIKELSSLALRDRYGPAFDLTAFPAAPVSDAEYFWSSTHLWVASPPNALVTRFSDGEQGALPRTTQLPARLVRTAP